MSSVGPTTSKGTRREQYACEATQQVWAGRFVRLLKRPRWGIRHARKNEVPFGVSEESARAGEYVWVTVYGPTRMRIE
jgi:hypothetical protein